MAVAPKNPASPAGKPAAIAGKPTGGAQPAQPAKTAPAPKPAPQPAKVITPHAGPVDDGQGPDWKPGAPEPDFDKLISEHNRESATARAEARRAKYAQEPVAEPQPAATVELEAEPGEEPEQPAAEEPAEPEPEQPAEAAAESEPAPEGEQPPAEGEPKPEDKLTLDEAREALRLAREDPKQFAAKFAPALFSRQFEAISRREAAVLQREKGAKQAEAEVTAARNIVQAVRDPARFGDLMKFAGPQFYDQLTRFMLNGGAPSPQDLAAQRDQRLEALEAARASDAKAAEDRATVAEWRGELRGIMAADKYAPLRELEDAPQKVEALAAEMLRQHGRMLRPQEAADILLEELTPAAPDDATIDRLLSDPQVRSKLEQKLGAKPPAGRQGPTPRVGARAGDAQALGNDTTVTKRQQPLRRADEESEFERMLATAER